MISSNFDKLFVVRRAEWSVDQDGNAYSELTELESFYGHLQQAQASRVEGLGMSLTNAYSIWCPFDTDVKAGDILMTSSGQFSVKAVQKFDIGDNRHLQLVVQLDEVTGS